jgi:hypothetical protein
VIRIPRMIGLPLQMASSTVIRFSRSEEFSMDQS